jgi:hypothetical protein
MTDMNRMRRSASVVAASLLVGMTACENGLTDINRNPNSPEEVPVEYLLAGGIWNTVVSSGSAGFHNYWTMMYHTSLWVQHVAQSYEFVQDRYTPRPGINTQIWDNAYAYAATDFEEVKRIADEDGNANLWAVAEIMQVYNFLTLTDLFGDIPYFEALSLEEGIRTPAYDPQSEIYPDLLSRLAAAVAMISPSANGTAFADGDLIYGGNMVKWRQFGNSLRLRAAMRIADTPQSQAASDAFAAAWNAGVMQSIDDAAQIVWPGTSPGINSLHQSIVQGARTGDFRVSESLVDTLLARSDPRLAVYAELADSGGVYRGLRNGMDPANVQIDGQQASPNHFSRLGSYFLAASAPSVIMSYAEVLFLGAEAAERGWIAADPGTLYRQAITASMMEYGIPQTAITTYLLRPNVLYTGLESIYLQKWIALFLAGPEAFNEFRRTGVPDLQLAANATEPDFPQRILYPPEEGLYNVNNFPSNVTLMTPVWWSAWAD